MVIFSILTNRKPLYVQTLHGRADKQYNGKFEYLLKKWLYKNKWLKLITIAKNNDDSFASIFNTNSNGIIYNGRGKLISFNINEVKKEINAYKTDENTIVITHVARYHHEKNQELLIKSFNQIISQGANAILLIIGNGYDSEKGKILQSMACDKIFFLGLKKNVGDYLNNSHAFILSSLNEAMPISLIEALACRCIPLSTPVSGLLILSKTVKTDSSQKILLFNLLQIC